MKYSIILTFIATALVACGGGGGGHGGGGPQFPPSGSEVRLQASDLDYLEVVTAEAQARGISPALIQLPRTGKILRLFDGQGFVPGALVTAHRMQPGANPLPNLQTFTERVADDGPGGDAYVWNPYVEDVMGFGLGEWTERELVNDDIWEVKMRVPPSWYSTRGFPVPAPGQEWGQTIQFVLKTSNPTETGSLALELDGAKSWYALNGQVIVNGPAVQQAQAAVPANWNVKNLSTGGLWSGGGLLYIYRWSPVGDEFLDWHGSTVRPTRSPITQPFIGQFPGGPLAPIMVPVGVANVTVPADPAWNCIGWFCTMNGGEFYYSLPAMAGIEDACRPSIRWNSGSNVRNNADIRIPMTSGFKQTFTFPTMLAPAIIQNRQFDAVPVGSQNPFFTAFEQSFMGNNVEWDLFPALGNMRQMFQVTMSAFHEVPGHPVCNIPDRRAAEFRRTIVERDF